MLTRKQKELLILIRDRMAGEGVPPSFDEMKAALGLKSKSGIHRLITGLEERGFIKRLPHRARALEILRLPEGSSQKSSRKSASTPTEDSRSGITLPLYGKIAAGTPIEALRDPSGSIEVPADMLASIKTGAASAEHYALQISGDSMIEAGIMNGDNVIIRACNTVENGAIAVALVDDSEATLKYIRREGSQIALEPANKDYEIRRLPASRVKIQGALVGLIRRYQ